MRRSSSQQNEPQQRLRLTFSRGNELKYISHLDMMRLWHRALRRAGMPVAYSQGFNPQPRIAIASPLAVEVTSEGELIDVFMERKVAPDFFATTVNEQLPRGIAILGIRNVWLKLPSTQSQLRFAEYHVEVESDREPEKVKQDISALLKKETLPWQHSRGSKVHSYDLRALIDDIWMIEAGQPVCTLGMRLRNDSKGSGRPDQVIQALGFNDPARSIHRTSLIMSDN